MRQTIAIVVILLAFALAVVALRRSQPTTSDAGLLGGAQSTKRVAAAEQTAASVAASSGETANRKEGGSGAPSRSADLGRSTKNLPESLSQLIRNLASTYQTGVVPVRIRLQDQLSRYWEENPPPAGTLVGMVWDRSQPAELRTYLARTLANRVKTRAYSDDEKAFAFEELRRLVVEENEDSRLRADLAIVLTTIDGSSEAVAAVSGLLKDRNPQAVQKAVAALAHSSNPMAIEAAYSFVQEHERLMIENPMALLTALAPLSTTDKDVTPMLNGIVRQTADFELFAGALQCLIHAKPTLAILESIALAYTESRRFPQRAAAAVQMSRAAAKRNERLFQVRKSELSADTVNAFDQLLEKESKR